MYWVETHAGASIEEEEGEEGEEEEEKRPTGTSTDPPAELSTNVVPSRYIGYSVTMIKIINIINLLS